MKPSKPRVSLILDAVVSLNMQWVSVLLVLFPASSIMLLKLLLEVLVVLLKMLLSLVLMTVMWIVILVIRVHPIKMHARRYDLRL
jgi:hypothetical protein